MDGWDAYYDDIGFDMPPSKNRSAPLRCFEIKDVSGEVHHIQAQFAFDNSAEGSGLVFRRYESPTDDHTIIVSQFAAGSWIYFKEIISG